MTPSQLQQHITILGVLYLVFGCLGLLAAFIVFVVFAGAGILSQDRGGLAASAIVGFAIAVFLIVISAPGILGGIGLLKRFSWARILVLILAVLNLLSIPFGTILGIYSIWVLLQPEAPIAFAGRSAPRY